MNDIYEMMSTLRAVRRLRTDPIPDDVLERVLQAACWAPTGGNVQPWRVIVVSSPERKQALAEIYRPEWYSYVEGFKQRVAAMPEDQQPVWERTMVAGNYLADHLQDPSPAQARDVRRVEGTQADRGQQNIRRDPLADHRAQAQAIEARAGKNHGLQIVVFQAGESGRHVPTQGDDFEIGPGREK